MHVPVKKLQLCFQTRHLLAFLLRGVVLFEERFEAGLECIAQSLTKKSGIKTSDKVIQ